MKSEAIFRISVLIISTASIFFALGIVGSVLSHFQADALVELVGKKDPETLAKITEFLKSSNLKLGLIFALPHVFIIILSLIRLSNTKEASSTTE